jgi:hypothetical protein
MEDAAGKDNGIRSGNKEMDELDVLRGTELKGKVDRSK